MQSIFSKQVHPFKQLAFAMGFMVLVMLGGKALMAGGQIENSPIYYWEVSFSALMCFGLFNCILSVPYLKRGQYFSTSLISFAAIAVSGGFLASLLSGLSIDEAGALRWLFVVFTFSYLVFISIVNAMRKILEMAKKQDARLRGEDV